MRISRHYRSRYPPNTVAERWRDEEDTLTLHAREQRAASTRDVKEPLTAGLLIANIALLCRRNMP